MLVVRGGKPPPSVPGAQKYRCLVREWAAAAAAFCCCKNDQTGHPWRTLFFKGVSAFNRFDFPPSVVVRFGALCWTVEELLHGQPSSSGNSLLLGGCTSNAFRRNGTERAATSSYVRDALWVLLPCREHEALSRKLADDDGGPCKGFIKSTSYLVDPKSRDFVQFVSIALVQAHILPLLPQAKCLYSSRVWVIGTRVRVRTTHVVLSAHVFANQKVVTSHYSTST